MVPRLNSGLASVGSGKMKMRMDEMGTASEMPRRVPALITYLSPFRLVDGDETTHWDVTIEQINRRSWDYVQLHEVVGGLDVGLNAPYHMLIARDGAIALPPIQSLRSDQDAVEFFNRCLAALLLGGIYCESISLDHLDFGSVIDWKYIRSRHRGQAAANRFHSLIRLQMAPPIEAIALLRPRTLNMTSLRIAMREGLAALKALPQLSGEFLLKGVSGVARRDWGLALTNLWITIEQLTTILWEKEILAIVPNGTEKIDGRRDQLRDTRTWTVASRQEVLHQKGVLAVETLRKLYAARKARNDLVHKGLHPDEPSAYAAYDATKALIKTALGVRELPLFALNLSDHSLSDPFRPEDHKPLDPQYWMPIPKLPGEEELERKEAQTLSKSGLEET